MTKFIDVTVQTKDKRKGELFVSTSSILRFRKNNEIENTTLIYSKNIFLSSCIIMEDEEELIYKIINAKEAPEKFLKVNCGNPISNKFYDYTFFVDEILSFGICQEGNYQKLSEIIHIMPDSLLCATESAEEIYNKIYGLEKS